MDTGLRLNGLLALELWDLIVSVFGSVTQTTERTVRLVDTERSQKSQGKINVLENIDSVPSNVQSSRPEAFLYVFDDNEAVIKMIIKGRSLTMRHVSRTHRVALDWLFDRINLYPKIQIKYIDTKNQLADILSKGSFTRDEWNHLLCLFNVSHFSSTVCSDTMAKRSQQDSGEERVTAKSRSMMNLVARTPSLVSSSTSVEVKIHGVQLKERTDRSDLIQAQIYLKPPIIFAISNSWKASLQQVVQNWMTTVLGLLKSGKLRPRLTTDLGDLTNFLENGKKSSTWSRGNSSRRNCAIRKDEEVLCDRSGRPDDINSQEVARPQNFVIGNNETELELSVESRSFVNRVNDQVRKRQNRISSVTGNGEEHSLIWGMFMAVTDNGISNIHGKEFPKQS